MLCIFLNSCLQALLLCLAMATTTLDIFIRNTVDSCLVVFCLFLCITFLGLLFGIFLKKHLPTVPFHKTYFLWWPLGLLAFLSATAWLRGDTKQAALLEQPVQPAATFSSDSLGLMSWWSSPDITSPSLGTLQTKVPLAETGTVAWTTDREIPLWVTPVQPAASKLHQEFYLDFPYPDIAVFKPSSHFKTDAVE